MKENEEVDVTHCSIDVVFKDHREGHGGWTKVWMAPRAKAVIAGYRVMKLLKRIKEETVKDLEYPVVENGFRDIIHSISCPKCPEDAQLWMSHDTKWKPSTWEVVVTCGHCDFEDWFRSPRTHLTDLVVVLGILGIRHDTLTG